MVADNIRDKEIIQITPAGVIYYAAIAAGVPEELAKETAKLAIRIMVKFDYLKEHP